MLDLAKGTAATLAGNGVAGFRNGLGTVAAFNAPTGLAVDAAGNVYVADNQNHRLRKITPAGDVTSLAGQRAGFADGTGEAASFYEPTDVAVGRDGTLYVADTRNNRLRAVKEAP